MFNIHLSQGSMVSFNKTCHKKLEFIENDIKSTISNHDSSVHFDETGIYVEKKRKWLHVASTNKITYYAIHKNRGEKALNDINILPIFKGIAVHDFWKSYFGYTNVSHAMCNAHILRELNAVVELEKQSWSKDMKSLLLAIKTEVDITFNKANAVTLDKIIALYAAGMTTRDISEQIQNLYDVELSADTVSNITNRVLPLVNEWQNRPLENTYSFVFMDAIHYKVREDKHIVSKAAYVVISVNMDGIKEAIGATFPFSKIQRSIIHQIRSSMKYIPHKDKKIFASDLKSIYKAINADVAMENLIELREKWENKYPNAIKSWEGNF